MIVSISSLLSFLPAFSILSGAPLVRDLTVTHEPVALHPPGTLTFQLRSDHHSGIVEDSEGEDGIFVSLSDRGGSNVASPTLLTRPTTVYRPLSPESYYRAPVRHNVPVAWQEMTIQGPDIESRHTLEQLARMSGNAYALRGQKNWYEVDVAWNTSFPFGWEDHADGFRGHVFVSSDNSTVILSIKGTTVQGPTSKKDKFNDNLLFSCCCARVDLTWMFATVCDCYAKHWRCDNTCLSNALVEDSLFYSVGVNLVNNVLGLYPGANLWLTGHSLGGALATLLGTTFGYPAVAFESPGDRLPAQRLHLPSPPGDPAITHVYHNADPIPQGACNGFNSPCATAGFALESRAHLGKSIVYDTITKLGWKVDVRRHRISDVISSVLGVEIEWEDGREVPMALSEDEYIDCYKWEFGDFEDKDDFAGVEG